MTKSMLDLNLDEGGVITDVHHSDEQMQRRLLDLGFSEGAAVKKVLTTPKGNPAAYKVRGAVIALRSFDAQFVTIQTP